jgi:hypothetical protein
MPNGGSDCCGTCWFNPQNVEEASSVGVEENQAVRCTIRNIDIHQPFSTYCANHPHHNPDRVKIPVGPVYHNEEDHPHSRRVWVFSPDNPTVRQGLIEVLEQVPEVPWPEYPFGKPFVEEVIHQLIAFREKRAIPGLRRILSFDPLSHSDDPESPYKTTRVGTVALAVEALAIIGGTDTLPDWQKFVTIGLEDRDEGGAEDYYAGKDKFALIRFHAVRGLRFCEGEQTLSLMKQALLDPHEEVRVFAEAMLKEKVGTRQQKQILQTVHRQRKNRRNWWAFWKSRQKNQ